MRLSRIAPVLFALTLYLTASGSAQAYEWTIGEEQLTSFGVSKETTTASGGPFELTVESLGITIQCESLSSTGEIVEGAKSTASGSFTGCTDPVFEACTVNSPGKSAGTLAVSLTTKFITVEVKGTPKYYDQLSPKMEILFNGEECPLLEIDGTVTGTTAAEVPAPGVEFAKRPRVFSQAIEKESGMTGLLFGGNTAVMTGKYTEELSGAREQQPIAVSPVKINPSPVAFAGAGAGNAKQVTTSNVGQRNVEIEDVGVTGPYGLTATANCVEKTLVVPPNNPNMCTVTATCNEAGKPAGYFLAIWNLGAGSKITRARMTC